MRLACDHHLAALEDERGGFGFAYAHDDRGKSLRVVLRVPRVQRDRLELQLHGEVARGDNVLQGRPDARHIVDGGEDGGVFDLRECGSRKLIHRPHTPPRASTRRHARGARRADQPPGESPDDSAKVGILAVRMIVVGARWRGPLKRPCRRRAATLLRTRCATCRRCCALMGSAGKNTRW